MVSFLYLVWVIFKFLLLYSIPGMILGLSFLCTGAFEVLDDFFSGVGDLL